MTVCTNERCDSTEFAEQENVLTCVKCGMSQRKRATGTHDSYPLGTGASMAKKERYI